MPIYAYRCAECGHAKDVLQKLSDPLLTTCPACGAEAFGKQLTAAGFQLKGSGWYATDFKGGPPPAASKDQDQGKDSAGKDGGGKDSASKDVASKDVASKDVASKDGSGKDGSGKGASKDSGGQNSAAAPKAASPAPAAPATPAPSAGSK